MIGIYKKDIFWKFAFVTCIWHIYDMPKEEMIRMNRKKLNENRTISYFCHRNNGKWKVFILGFIYIFPRELTCPGKLRDWIQTSNLTSHTLSVN